MVEPGRGLQNRRMIGIVVGVVVAFGCAFGVFLLSRSGGGVSGGDTTSVVVATKIIDPGSQITADELTTADRATDQIPADSFKSTDQAVGKFAKAQITPQTIVSSSLVADSASGVTTAGLAALDIPKGWVAMALPVTTDQGVGGYLQPEDHFDIIAENNQNVRYAFQDIRILKTSAPVAAADGSAAPAASSGLLIICVPRAEAEEIAFMLDNRANTITVLRYVLRPKADSSNPHPKGGTAASPAPAELPRYLSSEGDGVGSVNPAGSTNYQDVVINNSTWQQIFP